ncbi:MAG: cupin domain-containing protein [Candidatus Hydrogenedentes bacterium]|nr:cupin domain-containing protein [Candidatus Hydrogenedentota bacterium]
MTQALLRTVDISNATWFQGSRYSYPLRTEDTGGRIAFVDIYKRRGTEPPPHIHHREHELFVVLNGSSEFQVAGEISLCDVGSFAFLPRGIPHRFAVQNPWGHFNVIVAPSGFDEYLQPFSEAATHLGEPPVSTGPPDVAGMIARGAEFGIEFVPPGVDIATVDHSQPDGLKPIVRQYNEGEILNVLGITIRVKLSAAESGGALSVFMSEDPPRVGPPMHAHANEDETFLVIEGEYRVQIEDTIYQAKPGQIAHFPRGVAHAYMNAGDSPGKLLIVTNPGGFEAFFRDVDALCKHGMPSTDQLMPIAQRHGLDIVGPPIAV